MTDTIECPTFTDWIDCWKKLSEWEYEGNVVMLEYMACGAWESVQTQFDVNTAYRLAGLAGCGLTRLQPTDEHRRLFNTYFDTSKDDATALFEPTHHIEKFDDWAKYWVSGIVFNDEVSVTVNNFQVGVSRRAKPTPIEQTDTSVSLWSSSSKPVLNTFSQSRNTEATPIPVTAPPTSQPSLSKVRKPYKR